MIPSCPPVVARNEIVVVVHIHLPRELQLFQVSKTLDTRGPGFGSGKNRKQQRRKDGDDGDGDEQFEEGEGRLKSSPGFHTV